MTNRSINKRMKSKISNLLGGLAFLTAGLVASVPAQALSLGVDFAAPASTGNDNHYSLGWSFTTNSDVTVVGLGSFFGETWPRDQQVGLWNVSNHNLLASTFVTDTDTLLGSAPWRFHSIVPLQLTSGQTYVVGAQGGAVYAASATPAFDPRISYIELRLHIVGNGSNDPLFEPTDTNAGGCCGWFGGNIEIADATTPLPTSWIMMLTGLASFGLLAAYRRRKNGFAASAAA